MKRFFLTLTALLSLIIAIAQNDSINPNGYNVFYYENGNVSSEGWMKNGKPDGYWKTYYENGVLKSEGNRENFLLDSIWTFYSDSGDVQLQISYRDGKKHGIRKTFREDEIIEENFENDVKQGFTRVFYPDSSLKSEVFFIDGLAEGVGKEFARDGRVIRMVYYRKGYITDIENINRFDSRNKKKGIWKYFYDNGIVRLEGKYRNDLKHGYFKEYDREGKLVSTTKYVDGVKQENVAELAELDVRTDYYPDGSVKVVASYKGDVPQGVRRDYSKEGEIVQSYIFDEGKMMGKGIVNEAGKKTGPWKEYYRDGSLKAEGVYDEGKRVGEWLFYHPNGQLEQRGKYDAEGRPEGEWKWYFANGELRRIEKYYNGLLDGVMTEYNEDGEVIAEGDYIEDNKEGAWFYELGDHREEGSYLEGRRHGVWKHFYNDGTLSFTGEFIDGIPNGKHVWYWDNGKKKDEGSYIMGRKDGEWIRYNYDGTPLIIINYENGTEVKYDGITIKEKISEF